MVSGGFISATIEEIYLESEKKQKERSVHMN
jgi:hypothetical protein